jgi:hypothetical protein
MPLPDPHADEPTKELDPDILKLFWEAKEAEKAWAAEARRLHKRITEDLGDAHAGTVNGVKVISYRPKDAYAGTRIQKEYPDLAQHFMEYRAEFNAFAFAQAHPDLAEPFRVRALTGLSDE